MVQRRRAKIKNKHGNTSTKSFSACTFNLQTPRETVGFFFAQNFPHTTHHGMSLHIIQSHHNKLFLRYLFPLRWPHWPARRYTTLRYRCYTLLRPALSYCTKVKPPKPVPYPLAALCVGSSTFVRYESLFACQSVILSILFSNILATRIKQTPTGMGLSKGKCM